MQEQHTLNYVLWIDYDVVNAVILEWRNGKILIDSTDPLSNWWPGAYVLPTCNCPACKRYWELKQQSDEEIACETNSLDRCMEQLLAMEELVDREMVNEASNNTIQLDANPINVHYAIGILKARIEHAIRHLEKA